jgi:putative hemolysin
MPAIGFELVQWRVCHGRDCHRVGLQCPPAAVGHGRQCPSAHRRVTETVHSRLPVCRGSLDHLVGVARAKDLLVPLRTGELGDLETLVHQPVIVPESLPALRVLDLFRQAGIHLALVVDEYGGIQGLVTPIDTLEALVEDIPDAGMPAEPAAVRRENGLWLIDGMLPANELKALLPIGSLPGERRKAMITPKFRSRIEPRE